MAGGTPLIGLSQFHYVGLLQDNLLGANYDTSVPVPNITTANINFNGQLNTFFADDGPREVFGQIGEIEVTINVADLSPDDYAYLIGASHTGGIVEYKTSASSPYVAIGFKAQKANGEYRYIWVMKGKFTVPNASHQTKEASVNFQPQEIVFKGAARIYDDLAFRRIDSDDTTLPAGVDTSWFTNPDISAAVDALTIAVSPLDGAINVAITTTVTWTYNNAIQPAYVTSDNFYLMAGASLIAGALTLDATSKIVTFTPTTSLANSTLHVATANNAVVDVYGQKVSSNTITSFTTIV